MKKFYIQTLGCKVNQYESDGIGSSLERKGWEKGEKDQTCDLFIINTCSVTSKAGMQSRQAVRKIMRENPHSRVIVTGCHAQTDPDAIKKIHPAGKSDNLLKPYHSTDSSFSKFHIICNQDKTKVADDIDLICMDKSPFEFKKTDFGRSKIFSGFNHAVKGSMTRAYLKIQDGCEAFCTYCIVPYARGSYVSMPQEDVLRHVEALHDSGFKEVILTGIHTGKYGVDFKNNTSLLTLLEEINRRKSVHRIRLSSIEPGELSEDIINLAAGRNILCDHFHIPLQSGDNDVLKQMKRPYDTDLFEAIINRINQKLPFAGIGVDTLIGFPGETDEQFENTYNLIDKLPVSYLHVFPFSPREGTPAFSFKHQVDSDTIKERCAIMRRLDKIKRENFIKMNMKRELEGLVQHKRDKNSNMLKAVTSNYLNILLKEESELKGQIIDLEIETYNSSLSVTGKRVGQPGSFRNK